MFMTRITLSILIVLSFSVAAAQRLSTRSNYIDLVYKEGKLSGIGRLPTIEWIKPVLDFTSSEDYKIEIEAEIKSSDAIAEAKIVLLGKEGQILGQRKIFFSEDQKIIKVQQHLTLIDGSTVISIQVMTAGGVMVKDQRTVLVGKNVEDNLLAADRSDHALFFATDKYDNWDDLVNPIEDAHAIAAELKEKYNFKVEIVENSTVEEIWEKLRSYNERTFKPQDQLMIFFAGHGHYDESFGEGFVVAKNSALKDLSRTTYISHNRLRGVVNNIPCKHILLTMDVCFGGTIDPTISRTRGADDEDTIQEMLARKFRYRTRKYLTSGGKEYVSDGVPGKHSPFAEKIIESLRGRGGDDAVLTLMELQANLDKLRQVPRFGSFGDDEQLSDFVFVGKRH